MVMKIDVNLNVAWTRTHDLKRSAESYQNRMNTGNSIVEDASGNVWVAGTSQPLSGNSDGFIFGLNSTGTTVQGSYYYDSSGSNEFFNSIKRLASGQFVVAGYCIPRGLTAYNKMLVLKVSLPAGTINLQNIYPGPNGEHAKAHDVIERIHPVTLASEIYAAGQASTSTSTDGIVYKLNSTGGAVGQFLMTAPEGDWINAIDKVNAGGQGDGLALFGVCGDPTPNSSFNISALQKTYFSGLTPCNYTEGSPSGATYSLIKTNMDNTPGATSANAMPIALGAAVNEIVTNTCYIFQAGDAQRTASPEQPAAAIDELVSVYPNPSDESNEVFARFNSSAGGSVEIRIMDCMGRTVASGSEAALQGTNDLRIQTAHLTRGIYFVQLTANGKTFVQKLIRQ